jgi:hypothetical protein
MPKATQEIEIEKNHLDLYFRSPKYLQELPRFSWDSTDLPFEIVL